MGPKRKEKFSRNCREENSGGSETESASQPVLTFSSRQPAVPTPGSSGPCLRLQVSVCCKESSKWVGEQPSGSGPVLGRREGLGRAWETWRGSGRAVGPGPLFPVQPAGAPTAGCAGPAESHLRGKASESVS